MNPVLEFGFALANEIKKAIGVGYNRPLVDRDSASFVFKAADTRAPMASIVRRFSQAFEGNIKFSSGSGGDLSTVAGEMGAKSFDGLSIDGMSAVFNSGTRTLRLNWNNMQLSSTEKRILARLSKNK